MSEYFHALGCKYQQIVLFEHVLNSDFKVNLLQQMNVNSEHNPAQ